MIHRTDSTGFRSFVLFIGGYSVSVYGNFLNLIALNLFAFQLTGSALQTGVFMALRLSAGFVTGLVAGRVATGFRRKPLMIGCDLAQAAVLVVLAYAGDGARMGLLFAVAVVLGVANTLFTVALKSGIPDFVGQDQRVRANGLLVTGKAMGTVLGFASAGVIVGAAGFTTAFLINAVSFCVSAASVAWLPARPGSPSGDRPPGPARPKLTIFLAGAPILAGMVLLRGVDALASSSHNVALPPYATLVNPADPAAFLSWFWASWAAGSILAYRLVARLPRPPGGGGFAVGTGLMAVCFVPAFLDLPLPLLVAVAAGAGLADGYTEIAYTSQLQAAPDETRGVLFGLSATAESGGFAIGMLTASFFLESTAPLQVVAAFHGLALIASGLFLAIRLAVRRGERCSSRQERRHAEARRRTLTRAP